VGGGVKHAVVAAYIAKHNGGHEATGSSLRDPMHTLTCQRNQGLVSADVVPVGDGVAPGRAEEVAAFLVKYYRTGVPQSVALPFDTLTTKPRYAVVYVRGVPHVISDIGHRMLRARELFSGQGFPDSYAIDLMVPSKRRTRKPRKGRPAPTAKLVPISLTAQVRLAGNSVCPPLAAELVRANVTLQRRTVAA